MELSTDSETVVASVHYLKSSLAGLQTLYQTSLLLQTKKQDQEKLKAEVFARIEELNFRIELFTNYLLIDSKPPKPKLEFVSAEELFFKDAKLRTSSDPEMPNVEILTDKDLATNLYFYLIRFLSSKEDVLRELTWEKENLKLKLSMSVPTNNPEPKILTDRQLEQKMLLAVCQVWAKWLKLKLSFKRDKKTTIAQLLIPVRFNP